MNGIFTYLILLIISFTTIYGGVSFADENRYKAVIEESFYVVAPENKEKFMQVYRENLYPFWQEMKRRGIIIDDYKIYSQRIHTAKPLWTYKTVVKFPNYEAIDKWLEVRDDVYKKLFPDAEGYKTPRKEIDKITEAHWDEFMRELPLEKQ